MAYYLQSIIHLDSIPDSVADDMQFDYNGCDKWICSRALETPLSISPIVSTVSSAPLIFQMTGIIGCITHRQHSDDARTTVSFWLTCPLDTASRVFWSRIPVSLRTIGGMVDLPLDYREFFGLDMEARLCKIQIEWEVELDEEVRHVVH